MRRLYGKFRYLVVILGILTMLLVSSGIFASFMNDNNLQNLEDNPVTLHTSAENYTWLWNTTWGSGSTDYGFGVAVDAQGFVYCTGMTSFGAGGGDLGLVKFASNGTRLWSKTWGSSLGTDTGYDMIVDASGYVYCAANRVNPGTSVDLALVKFAPNGTALWSTFWGGTGLDWGRDVVMDASGFFYMAGYTTSFGALDEDLALVKFSPDGTKLWNTTWGGTGKERGYSVVVDTTGYLYVTGFTNSFGAGGEDIALVKFAPNGTKLWNITFGGIYNDAGNDITMDTSGFLYMTGKIYSSITTHNDVALFKFAPNGTKLWNITWGSVSSSEEGCAITVDASGNIFVTGKINKFGATGQDLLVVKFAPNGTYLWNINWGGSGAEDGSAIARSTGGSLYIVGSTSSLGAGSYDFLLVKVAITSEAGIPGFEFVYLLIGLLALVYMGYRRILFRNTS